MKHIQLFEEFFNEGAVNSTTPVKYVVWNLHSRDNKRVEQCSVVFTNKIAYHAQVPWPMEQHHPKLFQIQNGRNVRTELALDLGVIPPADSYSLTCGLENKIVKFLNFWKSEGYTLVYKPDTINEGLFKEWINKNGLVKFTKNTL